LNRPGTNVRAKAEDADFRELPCLLDSSAKQVVKPVQEKTKLRYQIWSVKGQTPEETLFAFSSGQVQKTLSFSMSMNKDKSLHSGWAHT
jgi:hypothetical protein